MELGRPGIRTAPTIGRPDRRADMSRSQGRYVKFSKLIQMIDLQKSSHSDFSNLSNCFRNIQARSAVNGQSEKTERRVN